MKRVINLNDLLKHEILDLYSAEEQVLENLPLMIENAQQPELKEALNKQLSVTNDQKDRLDAIKKKMVIVDSGEKDRGFFSALFGGSDSVSSEGVAGLVKEAKKIMEEEMTPQAMDAAIIGAVQKIVHYKIAGYGTANAYASELKLDTVTKELGLTLREVYDTDDSLTKLAVGRVNPDAEKTVDNEPQQIAEDDFDRLTNAVSIMSSSDSPE